MAAGTRAGAQSLEALFVNGRKRQVTSLNRKQKRRQAKRKKQNRPAPPTPPPPPATAVGEKLAAAKRLRRAGRLREALALGREILDADPKQAETLHFLGSLSMEVNNFETAANLIGKAIAVDSGRAGYYRDLGTALIKLDRLGDAACSFRHALRIEPDMALAGLDEVKARCREALAADPGRAEAHFAASEALKAEGRLQEALVSYRRALRLDPAYAKADTFESIALLSAGNLAKGWLEFEWRSTIGSLGPFTETVWNGEDLRGKTVLVWGEQGIGDQIMFANCIPDIIARAGRVIIEIDCRLVPLFARSFPAAAIHGEAKFTAGGPSRWQDFDWLEAHPPVDFFVPEGSLPRFFRPTLESFPSGAGYLAADRQRVAFWRRRLAGLGTGRKVGVSWRSLHMTERRAGRYPPLRSWAPLFSLPETEFIAVQANPSEEERGEIKERHGVELRTWDDIDLIDDLDDTAALLKALDAVVSADTYLPMMAGGLGLPVWRVTRSRKEEDWSFLGAERYPWFPSMTVRFGVTEVELTGVFSEIAAAVAAIPPSP